MDAEVARAPTNPGAAKVRRRLLASRARIQRDGHALTVALSIAPVASQPPPAAAVAIADLRKQLAQIHADVQHESGGGATGAKARKLTTQTIADARNCLAKLDAAMTAPDQATALKLLGEGFKLLGDAKGKSRKAGTTLGGSWPL
jgi:hypothetical protein